MHTRWEGGRFFWILLNVFHIMHNLPLYLHTATVFQMHILHFVHWFAFFTCSAYCDLCNTCDRVRAVRRGRWFMPAWTWWRRWVTCPWPSSTRYVICTVQPPPSLQHSPFDFQSYMRRLGGNLANMFRAIEELDGLLPLGPIIMHSEQEQRVEHVLLYSFYSYLADLTTIFNS